MVPLTRRLSGNELSELARHSPHVRILETEFLESPKKPKNLREACTAVLPSTVLDKLPRSYDVIGDVALIEIRDELGKYYEEIGDEVLKLNPRLRLVVRKMEKTTSQFRTRKVAAIAGRGRTETVHCEFSCRYRLDVNSVYFNPRLSHERFRVAKQVMGGEIVVDMFAGVGPYSILIAKRQPNVRVFAVDLNPAAYEFLKENIMLNRVADRVSCYLGDVRVYAVGCLRGFADRVIMNLPSSSAEFVDTAASLLKPRGGTIHYYTFASRDAGIEDVTRVFQSLLKRNHRTVESFTFRRAIKEVSPGRVQIVLDSRVR